jgi:hypothetical protein
VCLSQKATPDRPVSQDRDPETLDEDCLTAFRELCTRVKKKDKTPNASGSLGQAFASVCNRELFADIERQIQKWTTEAVELGHSMEALAIALRGDASRIDFRGDSIILDHKKSAEFQLILDLARIRNLVFCNI